MAFKKNKVKVDLCSYPHYMLLAPRKFGKTTFWSELVAEAWGSEDKGLLISFGNEEGYHSIDGVAFDVAKEWSVGYDEETGLRGFVEIVDDLVDNNSEYGIRGVCLDTLDTLVDVATKEILRLHRREKGNVCKSLNDAFSGYGRGAARLLELINAQINRLRDAGLAVFILCHIKLKERTDILSGEKFEQITNNLPDNIFTNIADTSQMVMVGAYEREIVDGKIVNEVRKIYLRENSTVDAGSRFSGLPSKIELTPKAFLEAFEIGVKNSMKSPVSNNELDTIKEIEEQERKAKSEVAAKKEKENKVDIDRNNELFDLIKSEFTEATTRTKNKVKKIMAEHGIESFKAPDELPTAALEKIAELLQ